MLKNKDLNPQLSETAVSGCYVYAFQYCHCVHESAYATLSLHSTEKGAQIAMEFHKEEKRKEFDEWEKSIEDYSFKFGEDERWSVYRFTILE